MQNLDLHWPSWKNRLLAFRSGWFWQALLLPFIVSRFVLILTAWFARYLTPNPTYTKYSSQGWFLSPYFLIDIWSRWDAKWYLSIVKEGYVPALDPQAVYSNLAFFPLYPALVRLLALPFSSRTVPHSVYLAVGILLSNLLFLAAAFLLYRLVSEHLYDEQTAARTLLLLMVFPAGFFFSAFYTESLFLFLLVAMFYAALRRRWLLACGLAGLAALTRPQGALAILPLFWLYMDARRWNIKAMRPDFFYQVIPPLCLAGYFAYLYFITGDPLAFFHAQGAWGRTGQGIFTNLVEQYTSVYSYVFKVDTVLTLIALAAALVALIKLPSRAYGVFALTALVLPLSTGSWVSMSRFILIAFPVFVLLARASRVREVYILLVAFWIGLQVLYFAAWTSYYFIA